VRYAQKIVLRISELKGPPEIALLLDTKWGEGVRADWIRLAGDMKQSREYGIRIHVCTSTYVYLYFCLYMDTQ
jgi:hypothetical protein